MDGPELGVLIAIITLIAIVLVVVPFAARFDRRRASRRPTAGATVTSSAAVFGGDGGANCSDGSGGSC